MLKSGVFWFFFLIYVFVKNFGGAGQVVQGCEHMEGDGHGWVLARFDGY